MKIGVVNLILSPCLPQALVTSHQDPDTQHTLFVMLFNMMGTPDPAQRTALCGVSRSIAQRFGPSWTATELLQLVIKQVRLFAF